MFACLPSSSFLLCTVAGECVLCFLVISKQVKESFASSVGVIYILKHDEGSVMVKGCVVLIGVKRRGP